MARRRLAAARRIVVLAVAFGVGLVVADRMMTATSIADDAAIVTTRPADADAPASRPAIPPDVRAVLDRVTAAYESLPIDLVGTLEQDFDVAGIQQKQSQPIVAAVRSASTFRHELGQVTHVVGDGAKTVVYDPKARQYVERPIDVADGRPSLDADAAAILAMQNPAAAIAIRGDAAAVLVTDATTAVALLEPAERDGRTFDRIELRSGEARGEAWIDRATGRIDRVSVDFAKELERSGATDVRRATATIRYDAVGPATAPSVADARFTFEPPAGATAAKVAARSIAAGGPAPAFTLDDLSGKPVKLADQKGHVVVLDFWATWCGPCRQSLPHVAAAAKDYADRGVRVYAINREESADVVRDYLAKAGLEALPVLLDADGAVSQSYRVTGIPFTVVIDGSGRISKTILGFAPGGEATLRQAIDEALTSARPAVASEVP